MYEDEIVFMPRWKTDGFVKYLSEIEEGQKTEFVNHHNVGVNKMFNHSTHRRKLFELSFENENYSAIRHLSSQMYLKKKDDTLVLSEHYSHDLFQFSSSTLRHKQSGKYVGFGDRKGYSGSYDVLLLDNPSDPRCKIGIRYIHENYVCSNLCIKFPMMLGCRYTCMYCEYNVCENCFKKVDHSHHLISVYEKNADVNKGVKCSNCRDINFRGRMYVNDKIRLCERCYHINIKEIKTEDFKCVGEVENLIKPTKTIVVLPENAEKLLFQGHYGPLTIIFSFLNFMNLTKSISRVCKSFNSTFCVNKNQYFSREFSINELQNILHPKKGVGESLFQQIIETPNVNQKYLIPVPSNHDWGFDNYLFKKVNFINLLVYACYKGYPNAVIFILDNFKIPENIDPNKEDFIALKYAITRREKRYDIISEVLSKSGKIDLTMGKRSPSMLLNLSCSKNVLGVFRAVINDKRLTKSELLSSFQQAVQYNYHVIVKEMLKKDFDIVGRDNYPFRCACSNNCIETLKLLMKDKRTRPNFYLKENQNPFQYAIRSGHVEIVRILMRSKKIDLKKELNRMLQYGFGKDSSSSYFSKGKITILQMLFCVEKNFKARDMFQRLYKKLKTKIDYQKFEWINDCVERNVCTFSVTGNTFFFQKWFLCKTCNLIGEKGICLSCRNSCHKDHDVIESENSPSRFYCDCGSCIKSKKNVNNDLSNEFSAAHV